MKHHLWIVGVLLGLTAVSCARKPPPGSSQSSAAADPSKADAQTASGSSATPKLASQTAAPVPPPGAQWTIYCDSITGPVHVQDASVLRARLVAASGMPDWYVIQGDKKSSLYYGYYGSLNNPAERKPAARDRAKIAALTDKLGNPLVRGDIMQPVDAPDPTAPAAWNLLNTPRKDYWTMEIATFSGNPKRKEAAVQMVRELRAKGETEAYYYHGPTSSSVCIGAWPRDAVAEQGTGIDSKGDIRDDAHTPNPDQSLLVFAGDKAPKNIAGTVYEPGTNKPMAVQGMKLDVQSADMKKKIAEYPYHYVNYELRAAVSGKTEFPDPSVLVLIPHDQSPDEDDWRLTGGAPSDNGAPAVEADHTPAAAGDDVLKSFGESVVELLIATANPGKAREFRDMLGPEQFTWRDLSQFKGEPVVEETGRTFEENARLKAGTYAARHGAWALADDSGLEIDALGGAPGVTSARWAEIHGAGRGDADNNALVLRQMKDVPDSDRAARFVCVLALADPSGKVVLVARDAVAGVLLGAPRGAGGFGYDPLFYVPELGRTTAELTPQEKHRISHRGKALRRMKEMMREEGLVI